MKVCFGCDNITCICSDEERQWAIEHFPKMYKKYCEREDEWD